MRQPVVQPVDGLLQLADPRVGCGKEPGPSGKTPRELLDPVQLHTLHSGIRFGLAQRADQRRFRAFSQKRALHTQHFGDPKQQLAADSAAVMLDKVEVRGGDSDLPCEVGLTQTADLPALPDPASGQSFGYHGTPPLHCAANSTSFCAAT